MTVTNMITLFAIKSWLQLDILAWIIGIPVLVILIVVLVSQYRHSRQLKGELNQLSKVKTLSVEYELVLKAMRLGVWRVDVASHKVTFDSDYRENNDLLYVPAGGTYQDVINHILPDYREAFAKGFDDLLAGVVDVFSMQYEVQSSPGAKPYWSETYFTVEKRDLNGHPETIVGTTMRIDQQKKIESALKEALYHAEESDRLKSAFLANISHEIRTPLNAIVGFSEVLSMTDEEDERQHLVGLIKKHNTQLLNLFDEMVTMSKLEARGGGNITKESFGLKEVVDELFNKFKSLSQEVHVTLQMADAVHFPQLFTDRERLREILNQYIDNALKFTTDGLVTVGCSESDDSIRIWVSDTGQGIPADKCGEHLFDRFFKVDEFVHGSGLGLSICRSLASSLGGQVGVESEYGKGSTFWVELDKESVVK
jgi:signal transduction histidine kinase